MAVVVPRSTASTDSSDEDMLVTLLVGQGASAVTLTIMHKSNYIKETSCPYYNVKLS